ncbi:Luc7-like protein [Hamiltosporidium tvaerminnensis]|uniref:Luc7-like protein n=2 Tax=Hamiltosporidium TaxID=1176354 RepID=A0A4Q9LAF4_9MICR|nr:Luc7-like protein 3 [Hamiltosporidium tvaerminnensis]TBU01072.1 Luc7-like protein [Hamiltosporidium tvaerminnensis]TBU04759.1 Luc7-like protein [Hamiltosporidium magnivora]
MADRARLLLDELMGKDRDSIHKITEEYSFNNTNICKYNLVSFCPFNILKNTKACSNTCKYTNHEEYYVSLYNKNGEKYRKKYEMEMLNLLKEFIFNMEIRKSKNQDILDEKNVNNYKSYESSNKSNNQTINVENVCDLKERISIAEKKMSEVLVNVKNLFMVNKVSEAYECLLFLDKIKFDSEKLYEKLDSNEQRKNLSVCEICGALINMKGIQSRLNNHFNGRMHKGFVKIRNVLADLLIKYESN